MHSYSASPPCPQTYRHYALLRRMERIEAQFGELEDLVTLEVLAREGVQVIESEVPR